MKRGIEAWSDYDRTGTYVYKVQKKRGHLTLDEIRDAIREAGDWDYYYVLLDCFNDDDSGEDGDLALVYRADSLRKE